MPSTVSHLDDDLLGAIVSIIVGLHGGTIVRFSLSFLCLFDFLDIDTLTARIPLGVNELHISIEAAELRQELSLV